MSELIGITSATERPHNYCDNYRSLVYIFAVEPVSAPEYLVSMFDFFPVSMGFE